MLLNELFEQFAGWVSIWYRPDTDTVLEATPDTHFAYLMKNPRLFGIDEEYFDEMGPMELNLMMTGADETGQMANPGGIYEKWVRVIVARGEMGVDAHKSLFGHPNTTRMISTLVRKMGATRVALNVLGGEASGKVTQGEQEVFSMPEQFGELMRWLEKA